MINTLKMSFKIDYNYAINSFIYNLRRTPIIKNIISDKLYSKSGFKAFTRVLATICSMFKTIVFKVIYYTVIYYIAKLISPNNISTSYIHILFVFTIIGMFINSFILSTSRKKYINIILFNMNAKQFTLSYFIFSSLFNFIINLLILIGVCLILNINIFMAFILALFCLLSKGVGEAINVSFYKKYKSRIVTDPRLYFTIVITGLLVSLLPYIDIFFYNNIVISVTCIFIILFIVSIRYLFKITDYRSIYKKLNTLNAVMNNDNNEGNINYYIVDIKDKDKDIKSSKIKNKKGYDLFNTIFFERHKHLLLKSSKMYAIISFIIFLIAIVVIYEVPSYKSFINKFLMNNLGWFVIIMYFINRGEAVTRAMFFNCDHSMLTFNFYRNPDVIIGLFKKRLQTIVKINLIPAFVIGIALSIILYLSGGTNFIVNYLSIPIFIITLSIFFSVHYLVIYYLLQPYNKLMQMKSPIYSLISMGTYFVCYFLTGFIYSTSVFAIISIIVTIMYILIALKLVYSRACYTFKLK